MEELKFENPSEDDDKIWDWFNAKKLMFQDNNITPQIQQVTNIDQQETERNLPYLEQLPKLTPAITASFKSKTKFDKLFESSKRMI